MNIIVLFTGFEKGDLTLDAVYALSSAGKVILHTGRCACAEYLTEQGIAFDTLDELYETSEDFDEHTEQAMKRLTAAAKEAGEKNVVFCAFDSNDETARAVIAKYPSCRVIGGSPLKELESRMKGSCLTVSAVSLQDACVSPLNGILVREIDSAVLAGEVKLVLTAVYGDEADAYLRLPGGKVKKIALYELDMQKQYDHRCACLVNAGEGANADFETVLRAQKTAFMGGEAPEEDAVVRAAADLAKDIIAGECCGAFTVQDIMNEAKQLIEDEA